MTRVELQYELADLRLTLAQRRFGRALDDLVRKYRQDQPRAPKGTPEGGQWVGATGNAPEEDRIRVALAARLITQRVGLGDDRLLRHGIYRDMLGRQFTREMDATEFCPPTWPARPYYGP